MSTEKTEKAISKFWPDAEYKYFLYDPEDGMRYFHSAWDRDIAADSAIQLYLYDGWSEDVEQVAAGEITHHAVARNVEYRPVREDCDSDEDYADAIDDWGDVCEYKCSYEMATIDDGGEPTP